MNKQTIVYVGGFELPDKNAAAHRVLANAQALKDCGYNIVLVGVTHSVSKDCNASILNSKTIFSGFECYAQPYPKSKKDWLHYLTDTSAIEEILAAQKKLEAVVCYNYQSVALAKFKKYARCHNIKIIADCTEWYDVTGRSFAEKILKGGDIFYRMNMIQKHLDGLILISHYLEKFYRYNSNVIVLPPLVDIKNPKWQCKPMTMDESYVNFIFAGSIGTKKDEICAIVDAFCAPYLYEVSHLWIIGISKDDFLKVYPTFSEKMDKTKVSFAGRVSHIESLSYVKAADCSLIIRDKTRANDAGFPTKFVEAVTLGTDVLATDTSDLKAYVEKIPGLTVFDGEIREALKKKANDIVEKKKKGWIKQMNNCFDYRNYVNDIKSLFKNSRKN